MAMKKTKVKTTGGRSSEGRQGKLMHGSEILVACLEREGVDTIFAYPGGSTMWIHQALTKSKHIRTILPRHEQGGVFMADGYARSTGKVGVCMATSGPGATNLVTGIADAYMDSVPLVAITGQVTQDVIGKNAFQETDMFGLTLPIVKHSYLVLDVNELPRIVKEAFYIASTGRPGPVVIDVPKSTQMAQAVPVFPETIELRGYHPAPKASDEDLEKILDLLEKSERPILYAGGGVISSGAMDELRKFAIAAHIPVTTTLMGIGSFPEEHPLSLKWLGMHGTAYANFAVDASDLLLAFGVRFDDRVTGKVSEFAKHATIVHMDIDFSEFNKNKAVTMPVLSDLRYALQRLNEMVRAQKRVFKPRTPWLHQIAEWKQKHPLHFKPSPHHISPQSVIQQLHELTRGEAIISTGVGQHQMWTGQFYIFHKPRTLLTSAGLGSMGFGLPAAIGAKVANPDVQVVDIDGDGSFLMNIQELATAFVERVPVKVVILNNQHLGMVVQWEDRFFESNRGHTYLGDPQNPKDIYPDYVTICRGFNIKSERVTDPAEIKPALKRMLDSKEAYVLDIKTPHTEHVLPMIPANKTVRDILLD